MFICTIVNKNIAHTHTSSITSLRFSSANIKYAVLALFNGKFGNGPSSSSSSPNSLATTPLLSSMVRFLSLLLSVDDYSSLGGSTFAIPMLEVMLDDVSTAVSWDGRTSSSFLLSINFSMKLSIVSSPMLSLILFDIDECLSE